MAAFFAAKIARVTAKSILTAKVVFTTEKVFKKGPPTFVQIFIYKQSFESLGRGQWRMVGRLLCWSVYWRFNWRYCLDFVVCFLQAL